MHLCEQSAGERWNDILYTVDGQIFCVHKSKQVDRAGTLRVKPTTFSSALSINAEVLCQTCDCEKVRFAISLKPISCSVCLFQTLHFCFYLNIRARLKTLCAVMAMVILSVGNASVLKDGMMEMYLL